MIISLQARRAAQQADEDLQHRVVNTLHTRGMPQVDQLRVTAVDGAHKEQLLRRIGADHFIDYAKEDFRKGGRKYDVIFSVRR